MRASAADLDVVMGVWAAATAARARPPGPVRAARVRERVASAELVLLARYGDRPAGMALAETFLDTGTPGPTPGPTTGPTPDPMTGHVAMVCTDPALWGSGVGHRLLRDLQTHWPRLSAWVRTDSRRALRLYVGAGFVETGERSVLTDGEEIRRFRWP